nr:MAG TPA: hypothetical protein [Caudoviricetes sp.]
MLLAIVRLAKKQGYQTLPPLEGGRGRLCHQRSR